MGYEILSDDLFVDKSKTKSLREQKLNDLRKSKKIVRKNNKMKLKKVFKV